MIVKYLNVLKGVLKDGLKDMNPNIQLKDIIENLYHIKLQKNKLNIQLKN